MPNLKANLNASHHDAGLDDAPMPATLAGGLVSRLIAEHRSGTLPRLRRLWDYFRNPSVEGRPRGGSCTGKGYTLAQEQGLPARLTGVSANGEPAQLAGLNGAGAREIVIENDIAWRVHALVDFMAGQPLVIQSLAADPRLAAQINGLLTAVFDDAGGSAFFHDLALLGTVYDYADVLLRIDDDPARRRPTPGFALELIAPPRAIPVLNPDDYRRLDAYVIHFRRRLNRVDASHGSRDGFLHRLRDRVLGAPADSGPRVCDVVTHVWTAAGYACYHGADGDEGGETASDAARGLGELVERSVNRLGRVPVVHIQNLPQPFCYAGLSDVEPLIPLQDELNTRLCDRANRVTFQSFKMYLGKGIESFIERPVGPGQMWATDNEAASIQEFGGDAASPSEDAHITEIREALDKASGVTPVAAGIIRDKIGNLTSENALRVVLMGLLAKTQKKRTAYGNGIARVCELVLHAADVLGVLRTEPGDRRVRIDWPPLLPDAAGEKLREAKLKLEIGVPRERVLAELGYAGSVA